MSAMSPYFIIEPTDFANSIFKLEKCVSHVPVNSRTKYYQQWQHFKKIKSVSFENIKEDQVKFKNIKKEVVMFSFAGTAQEAEAGRRSGGGGGGGGQLVSLFTVN